MLEISEFEVGMIVNRKHYGFVWAILSKANINNGSVHFLLSNDDFKKWIDYCIINHETINAETILAEILRIYNPLLELRNNKIRVDKPGFSFPHFRNIINKLEKYIAENRGDANGE